MTDTVIIYSQLNKTEGYNSISYDFESNDIGHLQYEGFCFAIDTPQNYIDSCSQSALVTHLTGILWRSGDSFHQDHNMVIAELTKYLKKIKSGNSDLEILAKIGARFAYYSEDILIDGAETTYSLHHLLFNEKDKALDYQIEIGLVVFHRVIAYDNFKISFPCSISFTDGTETLSFEVFCYSPKGVYNEVVGGTTELFFPPHLLAAVLEVKRIKEELLNTLTYLKAGSVNELKLKLATLTRSFDIEDLLPVVCSSGTVYTFDVKDKKEEI